MKPREKLRKKPLKIEKVHMQNNYKPIFWAYFTNPSEIFFCSTVHGVEEASVYNKKTHQRISEQADILFSKKI
jgi:hypothetical protein